MGGVLDRTQEKNEQETGYRENNDSSFLFFLPILDHYLSIAMQASQEVIDPEIGEYGC